MSKFVKDVIGGVEIAAGIVVGALSGWTGIGLLFAANLITAGVGQVLSGIGTLIAGSGQSIVSPTSVGGGTAFATRNPIASRQVIYGKAVTGGTFAFERPFEITHR
ncbi:MAG TPA: hypothetical protein VFC21_06005 [Bryobacteraceae bacterium]|nr:hypothetical protein [Bryobacteraceae bacterium]